MSSTASSPSNPATAGDVAGTAHRVAIRRAIAMPAAEGTAAFTGTPGGTPMVLEGHDHESVNGSASSSALTGGWRLPFASRRTEESSAADPSAQAPLETSLAQAVAAAGATAGVRENRQSSGPQIRSKPLLIAAAVAGAVLTSLPFIASVKGHSVNYDAAGGAKPTASLPQGTGEHAAGTDGHTSSVPLPGTVVAGSDAGEGGSGDQFTLAPPGDGSTTDTTKGHTGLPLPLPANPTDRKSEHTHTVEHPGSPAQLASTATTPRTENVLTQHGSGSGESTGVLQASAASTGARPASLLKAEHATPAVAVASATHHTVAAPESAKPAVKHEQTSSSAGKSTATANKPASNPVQQRAVAAKSWSTEVVKSTSVLKPGESWSSNRMRVTMSAAGSLIIVDENGVTRWSSHTDGSGYEAVFQGDGHLVVYSKDGKGVWSSGTAGNPGAEMVIQADGNVTILSSSGSPIWAAGTQH
ncbi:hypothetical protein [Streptomyces sp. NPDC090080]|uniref:hypothetical protein n=1 Tax=Streptomyces sp. NPDC090080 TaxID=3365939 RepID=UPI00380F599E